MSKKKDPIEFHKELVGKIIIKSKVELDEQNLPIAYTPGVGAVSKAIAENKNLVNELTGRQNKVAIVSDGSAVLGLGNIGAEAALPVMEGKAAIFAQFANINAVPMCICTQDVEEIIKFVKCLEPSFGGINLEDISAPRCFEIEKRLEEELNIPVFHDDQHGTAIVTLAGIINALKITGKDKNAKIIISGAGAAGIAIAKLLAAYGMKNYCLCDSKGSICEQRVDLNGYKKAAVDLSVANCATGTCNDALVGADILIGVSQPNQFTAEVISKMNHKPIVFALANPIPEIMPDEAKKGGAVIVATGRSDFANQINNALVFPGLFRGLLDNNITKVTDEIKVAVAEAIAGIITEPTSECIIPSIFDKKVVDEITKAVSKFK